jgi:hypothetical protein
VCVAYRIKLWIGIGFLNPHPQSNFETEAIQPPVAPAAGPIHESDTLNTSISKKSLSKTKTTSNANVALVNSSASFNQLQSHSPLQPTTVKGLQKPQSFSAALADAALTALQVNRNFWLQLVSADNMLTKLSSQNQTVIPQPLKLGPRKESSPKKQLGATQPVSNSKLNYGYATNTGTHAQVAYSPYRTTRHSPYHVPHQQNAYTRPGGSLKPRIMSYPLSSSQMKRYFQQISYRQTVANTFMELGGLKAIDKLFDDVITHHRELEAVIASPETSWDFESLSGVNLTSDLAQSTSSCSSSIISKTPSSPSHLETNIRPISTEELSTRVSFWGELEDLELTISQSRNTVEIDA